MERRKKYIEWLRQRRFILFGAGNYARQFFEDFHDFFSIEFCITNNAEEKALTVDGKEVLPVYRVKDGLCMAGENAIIVLCAAECRDMEEQLGYLGYSYGKDYISSKYLRLLVSPKKIAMVYGVCYTRSIYDCLKCSEAFCKDYEISNWMSYLEMNASEYAFFTFALSFCDLYFYNSCISFKDRIKNDGFLARLPENCKTICIPVIGSSAYHPQSIGKIEGNNPYCVISSKTSWAPFLSPDWNINRLLDEGKAPSEILKIIGDENYYQKDWLNDNYIKQIKMIQIRERMADIKISDYLLQKHGVEKLFLNEMHISNSVIIELTKRILRLLGYSDRLPEEELIKAQLLYTSEVPLYPSVIEKLSLEIYQGKDVQYDLFTFHGRKKVTFEEYVMLYCDFCGNMMRFMKYGLFPA